ncbi:hypothetical protein BX616_005745 [Lobosporangium transversale]|nr:hypothetical protein BX616_005745 [Lobosporangium transversale]
MQVDELERIKLGYYFSNLESEQANLQLILQKTSTIVRAEVDIYERIASKGLNDSILEPMTTQGPDPYFIYPTTEEFSSIFSILPSTPIIPTTGAGATGTITPQPDAIISSFYGYHENNPFSTARNLNNSTTRDRHLFGDASSIESKEESVLKKAATIVSIGQQHKPPALDSKSNATTVTTTTSTTSTTTTTTAASIATRKDTASASLSSNDQKRAGKGNQVQAIETISEESDKSASSSEKTRQAFGTRSDEGDDSSNSTAKQESKQSEESSGEATVTENQASTSHSTQNGHNETSTTRSSNGVDLQAGKQHHRNQTATSPSVSAPATPSEPASSVRSHSLRSRSGSRSHLLASTPDSPPVRGMIHIGQDSELLNNRDFSFSYEPSELLEQRNMHSQLNLSRHGAHNGLQPFAFHELEEEEGGFGATPPTRLMRTTHSSPSSQQHHPGHSHSQSNSPSASQTHSRNHSHHLQGLRHHSSDGQLSQSSSSVLSSVGSTHSGLSLHGTLQHRRSTGRIKTDLETAANMFDKSLDEPFLPSMTARGPTASEDRLREMRRGFDDGMPAFFPDEIDLPSQNSQPRSLHGFGSGSASGNASRRQSGFDQDMDKTFDTSPPSSVSNRPPSVVESIRMADGSSKNVSMTNVNEIAA